jgi:hypothetical protein
MKLWHDDVRPPPEGWVWARTNEAAKELLLTGKVEEISLDHDLGYHNVEIPDDPDKLIEVLSLAGRAEETGLDLVHWMVQDPARVPSKITIHSWNPNGALNMAARFNLFGHNVTVKPFSAGSGFFSSLRERRQSND